MENIHEDLKKKRIANFTSTERSLLLKITNSFRSVIECKKTDSCTWRDKLETWKKVEEKFNSCTTGAPRNYKQLKNKYEAIKKELKKRHSNHRSYQNGTGGGPYIPPPPSPENEDEKILAQTIALSIQGFSTMRDSDGLAETSGELGWVLTLVIVSLTSALIGAIVMIIVLHCKRMKNSVESETERGVSLNQRMTSQRPPISTPEDKEISTITPSTFPHMPSIQNTNNGVWSWLSRRSTNSPSQLNSPSALPAENHYTHMEDGYNSVGEALYAELDRESSSEGNDRDSNSPAYQNSAYTDPDAPTSSAPSSAYYSDLSTTTVPERAYEIVGLVTIPSSTWDQSNANSEVRRPVQRLAAISENVSIPSDYL